MTLLHDIERFVCFKRKLGLDYTTGARKLRRFGNWAAERGERHIRHSSVVSWTSTASSLREQRVRLQIVRQLAVWLHAEDPRHEIPPADAVGRIRWSRRPSPQLLTDDEIRLVMEAALQMSPADSINRYTYHYCIGLLAATGLRVSEACSLKLTDLTADGLVIQSGKFRKSRLVAMHPTTRQAVGRYLAVRARYQADSDSLFVLSSGRTLYPNLMSLTFRQLLRKVGLRGEPGTPGSRLHDLRHAFATRSIESAMPADRNRISRHMLALSTYMGHAEVSSTYWYLEATPVLLRQIADAAQNAYENSGRHDASRPD